MMKRDEIYSSGDGGGHALAATATGRVPVAADSSSPGFGRVVARLFRVPLLVAFLWIGIIVVVDPYWIFGAPSIPGINVSRPFYETYVVKVKPYQVMRLQPKVVALGSSRSEVGMSPDHPGWADRNAFNFAIPAANSYEVMLAFLHAQAVGAPLQQAVVGLDFLSFGIYRKVGPAFHDERFLRRSLQAYADFLDAELPARRQSSKILSVPNQPEAMPDEPPWDEEFYLSLYPDVAAAVAGKLFSSGRDHFERAGRSEGRHIGGVPPDWDEGAYLRVNPDVATAVAERRFASGFHHYIAAGRSEGRQGGFPSPHEKLYLSIYPDVAAAVEKGLFASGRDHYERAGRAEGRYFGDIPADWDEATYLAANPDVAVAVAEKRFVSGFHHYIAAGRAERRLGGFVLPNWDEAAYLAANPAARIAIARGQFRSGYAHFAVVGRSEGRAGGLPPANLLEWGKTKWPELHSWLFKAQELASLTISPTAFRHAVETIMKQSAPPVFSSRGQRVWAGQEEVISRMGGIGKVYRAWISESRAWRIFWWDPPERMYCISHPLTGMSTLDPFRFMLRRAYAEGTDLRLFVSPLHASIRRIIHVVGLEERFEFWLKELVRINEEEAVRAGREPYAIWDFTDFNSITTEPVPNAGDYTPMRWFWEVTHYRQITGDLVLDRIFGTRQESRPLPDDFGVRLSSASIDAHIDQTRIKQRRWAEANPDIAEIIERAARPPRMDHQAEAKCW